MELKKSWNMLWSKRDISFFRKFFDCRLASLTKFPLISFVCALPVDVKGLRFFEDYHWYHCTLLKVSSLRTISFSILFGKNFYYVSPTISWFKQLGYWEAGHRRQNIFYLTNDITKAGLITVSSPSTIFLVSKGWNVPS